MTEYVPPNSEQAWFERRQDDVVALVTELNAALWLLAEARREAGFMRRRSIFTRDETHLFPWEDT